MASATGVEANTLGDTKGNDWNDMAKHYKKMTAEVSHHPIGRLLARANELLPWSKATAILDNGCGPGPVLSRIIEDHGSEIPRGTPIMAADFSQGMIDAVRDEKTKQAGNPLWDDLETDVLNAMDMQGVADDSKSHITAGWVYFMTPDPQKCLTESRRVLKDGGVLSLSSWQGNEWMDTMLAVSKVRPAAKVPELPKAWKTVEGVTGELEKAGFKDVVAEEVEVFMDFETREGTVKMFMETMPHVKNMMADMTDNEVQKVEEAMMETMKDACPNEPGRMKGVAIVGAGRK